MRDKATYVYVDLQMLVVARRAPRTRSPVYNGDRRTAREHMGVRQGVTIPPKATCRRRLSSDLARGGTEHRVEVVAHCRGQVVVDQVVPGGGLHRALRLLAYGHELLHCVHGWGKPTQPTRVKSLLAKESSRTLVKERHGRRRSLAGMPEERHENDPEARLLRKERCGQAKCLYIRK